MVDTPGLAELTSMRDEVTGWLPDLADISRITATDDAFGGQVEDGVTIATAVPCSLESGASQEQIQTIADKLTGLHLFTVTFPALTDVQADDQIIVTSQGNLELRVQAVMDPESWELEVRTTCSTEGEHFA
jgi:head-tail adaptor